MYVIDWLNKQAQHYPDKTALVDLSTGREITYRQFNQRASRFAEHLRDCFEVKPGDRVAVLANNSSDYFEMLYGCAKIGAIMVCLNWRLPATELSPIFDDASPVALIYGSEFSQVVDELSSGNKVGHLMRLGDDGGSAVPEYEACLAAASGLVIEMPCRSMDEVWHLLYTSGTTGKPKGVIQTYGMVFFNAVNAMLANCLSRQDVLLNVLPFFHTGGLNLYANPILHAGGTVYIMKHFDAAATIELLDSKITMFLGVPAVYLFISQQERFQTATFKNMRNWSCGGSPIPVSLLEQYQAKGISICYGFGMTETGPTVFLADEETARRKIGSVGKPVGSMLTRIVEHGTGADLGPYERGELLIKGPGVTPGYWNRPEATEATLIDGWLHSGDIAYFDDDGDYYIVDRSKDMFISGGENVYPAEVENVLFQLEQIAEVAVIGVPDAKWVEVGKAIVVLKPDAKLSVDEIRTFCRERLAGYKIPKHYEFIGALPRTPSGKVEKPKLRELYGSVA